VLYGLYLTLGSLVTLSCLAICFYVGRLMATLSYDKKLYHATAVKVGD